MAGKKESMLEKILRPVRAAPVFAGGTLLCLATLVHGFQYDGYKKKLANAGGIPVTAVSLYGWHEYWRKSIKEAKYMRECRFSRPEARKAMRHYCDRQAFYVAAVQEGYRDEIRGIIRKTPNKRKEFHFIPNF